MTQEIKPCPGCKEPLHPEYTSKHEMDAELLYYYHEEETDCVFDGFYLWLENVDKWNALPRHNEPQWLPIISKLKTIIFSAPELNMGNYDYDDVDALNAAMVNAYLLLEKIPNPPEVTK